MKKSNLLLLGALISVFFFSLLFQFAVHRSVKSEKAKLKSTEILEEQRTPGAFTSLKAVGKFTLVFEQSDSPYLKITAPDYVMDSIQTIVDNNRLDIQMLKDIRKKDTVLIHLGTPQLDSLMLTSQVYFKSENTLKGEYLYLELMDACSADLDIDFSEVLYKNLTSGKVNLNGKIKNIQIMEE